MRSVPRLWLAWAVAVVPLIATAAAAQDPDRAKLAITDPAHADADFAFQGEYVGPVFAGGTRWSHQHAGLQVVALGDGAFQAALYRGGLPGWGWDRSSRIELTGTRRRGVLDLLGDGAIITVRPPTGPPLRKGGEGGSASILSGGRPLLGTLHKVRRTSPTLGAPPPPGAVVLFGGTSLEKLDSGRISPEGWLMENANRKDIFFEHPYRDFFLHLEFRLSYMPYARGQGRSNSGVYIQSRYEVQILDSFGLQGKENECGGLYRLRSPEINMCLPPLSWQTYDIEFTAARFDAAGRKSRDARITVLHNGVPIHTDFAIPNKTGAGQTEGPKALRTKLQHHGDPIRFRNIWL
ncbi:MAG: DUF1080 domain-containing protein, partial [Planctomycetes bacterium]|nr:DUF1080 domain-containing protein [Planctomycetota bacterium]